MPFGPFIFNSDDENTYRQFNPHFTIICVLFMNLLAFITITMCELSNQWIRMKIKHENITYYSGHYFGCVKHIKNETYVCSPHIMYMRQTTFTHGVGHHAPEWLIQRIRRFHYFETNNHKLSNNFSFKEWYNNYKQKKKEKKNNKNIDKTNNKSQLGKLLEGIFLAFPNSYSTSVLMVDNNLINSQFNLTSFLNNITKKNEPQFIENENINNTHSSYYDIENQDDLLLISELLILNNSLTIVPINEIYHHFSDNDTSSTLLSIKISFIICISLIILSFPFYIGLSIDYGKCRFIKTILFLSLLLTYQSIIGFFFLNPLSVFIVNILYDNEYYSGEPPLIIGFGNTFYIAIISILIIILSIIIISISIILVIRNHKASKYIRLYPL